jgi:hypothetical protein
LRPRMTSDRSPASACSITMLMYTCAVGVGGGVGVGVGVGVAVRLGLSACWPYSGPGFQGRALILGPHLVAEAVMVMDNVGVVQLGEHFDLVHGGGLEARREGVGPERWRAARDGWDSWGLRGV